MEWMLLPLKRYADFSGRSRRKEYWLFTLGYGLVVGILAMVMGGLTGLASGEPSAGFGVTGMLLVLLVLAGIVPSVAVQVRRFHDQDKSGWMVLLGFVPLVGGLIVLVFMCLEGTRGANGYGPDPKGSAGAAEFGTNSY